jgi:hypothetical protein
MGGGVKDLTQDPRVLEVCGWMFEGEAFHPWRSEDQCSLLPPRLTMSELWEGLCKASALPYPDTRIPILQGYYGVLLKQVTQQHKSFEFSEYGSICNTLAAAIIWLKEKEVQDELDIYQRT